MSLEGWQDFLNESRKRGSGPGLERALKWFLDSGPQKKGGYKGKRKSFKKKKFNDISAPPGAPEDLKKTRKSAQAIASALIGTLKIGMPC